MIFDLRQCITILSQNRFWVTQLPRHILTQYILNLWQWWKNGSALHPQTIVYWIYWVFKYSEYLPSIDQLCDGFWTSSPEKISTAQNNLFVPASCMNSYNTISKLFIITVEPFLLILRNKFDSRFEYYSKNEFK